MLDRVITFNEIIRPSQASIKSRPHSALIKGVCARPSSLRFLTIQTARKLNRRLVNVSPLGAMPHNKNKRERKREEKEACHQWKTEKKQTVLGLGTVHIRTGTVPVSVPEIRYWYPTVPFSVLYSLCNNKSIHFSEKNKSKTLNFNILNNRALQFLSSRNYCVLFFSDNQMKAWNIYLFLIKWKWNPFIFCQTNRGLLLKLIHGRNILWIFL